MATTRALRGFRPAVIRALAGATRGDLTRGYLVPNTARPVYDILEAKNLAAASPDSPGDLFLTPNGADSRRMLLEIASSYRSGVSALTLSRIYKVSDKTILRWITVLGVPVRPNGGRVTPEQRLKIAAQYMAPDKPSMTALALRHGLTRRTISYHLRKMQVPVRSPRGGRPSGSIRTQ